MESINRSTAIIRAMSVCLICVVLLWVSSVPARAQSFDSFSSNMMSVLPLQTLERYFGPLLPEEGFGNTFRSELGTGAALVNLLNIRLLGSQFGLLDVVGATQADEFPYKYDVHMTLRWWRFGLRGIAEYFEPKSLQAEMSVSGFRAGFDFDLVHRRWLTVGITGEHYFYEPEFRGYLNTSRTEGVPNLQLLEIRAQEPPTVAGPYIRYVPPELLGFPCHIEAFWNIPIRETYLMSFGGAFVFRPQIYRFDLAAKIFATKHYMDFTTLPTFGINTTTSLPFQEWQLKMEWETYGLQFAAYF